MDSSVVGFVGAFVIWTFFMVFLGWAFGHRVSWIDADDLEIGEYRRRGEYCSFKGSIWQIVSKYDGINWSEPFLVRSKGPLPSRFEVNKGPKIFIESLEAKDIHGFPGIEPIVPQPDIHGIAVESAPDRETT